MQPDPSHAFYNFIRGRDFRAEMIAWAVEVLCSDGDGHATALLAGADHESDRDVVGLFRRAAIEQKIPFPDSSRELEWCETFLCTRIVSGATAPRDGLKDLYKLWLDDSFSQKFQRWCSLADSIEHLSEGYTTIKEFSGMTLDTVDDTILREAEAVVATSSEQDGEACRHEEIGNDGDRRDWTIPPESD